MNNMITLLIKFIKLLVINRLAYAINEFEYKDKDNSKYNNTFYRIEKVLVKDVFICNGNTQYMLFDLTTNEDWGDTTNKVYFSKRKASKELLKLCKL